MEALAAMLLSCSNASVKKADESGVFSAGLYC